MHTSPKRYLHHSRKLLSLCCMKRSVPAAVTVFLLLLSIQTYSQEVFKPRPSPLNIASIRHKGAYLKITYGQPQKRGREIFGSLVPYGGVWRTGANEATEMTLTHDLTINNILLKAGTYSLFTIPEEKRWTIIINRDLGMWGAYNYNQKLDVFRFEVPVNQNSQVYEAFTISVTQRNEMADLLMMWDNIIVTIPIKFLN